MNAAFVALGMSGFTATAIAVEWLSPRREMGASIRPRLGEPWMNLGAADLLRGKLRGFNSAERPLGRHLARSPDASIRPRRWCPWITPVGGGRGHGPELFAECVGLQFGHGRWCPWKPHVLCGSGW